MEVTIIGAGIGGLTTALALQKAGIRCKIYEAAPELKPIGAGIILASNAMQIFRELGIQKVVEQYGNRISETIISNIDFKPLNTINLKRFEDQYQVANYAIHRADLHAILTAAVGKEHILTGKRLQHLRPSAKGHILHFEDGTTTETEWLIGADGIRSVVRESLFAPAVYRDARQICWRGVADFDLPAWQLHRLTEAWGRGKRFGVVPISQGKVYWYMNVNTAMAKEGAHPMQFTQEFHPIAAQLVAATPRQDIISALMYDIVPVKDWSTAKACLLGDAAHATTPNLGQGACQAIEDAYTLGALAQKYPLQECFEKYPAIRRAKAHQVVTDSWKFGKISHLENPFAVALRDLMLRLTPARIGYRQMDQLFRITKID